MRQFLYLTIALVGPSSGLHAADNVAASLQPIDIDISIDAPIKDVWDAWTTNAGAQKWFAPRTNIELEPGGAYEILFEPEGPAGQRGTEDLKVLCYLPQEMLAIEWNAPPQFPRARPQRTWVVVRFSDLGDGRVRVCLTHTGFADRAATHPDEKAEWEQVRDYFTKAWPTLLESMRKSCEKDGNADAGSQVCEVVVDAPAAAVWAAWTTKEGMESWQVAHAEIDLKLGGKIRTHYDVNGRLDDPNGIENIILAFEPNRLISTRVGKAPENFPFKEAIKSVWHVISLEDAGPGRTRVRVAGLGYGDDDESRRMRAFFTRGNAYTLKKLQEHFAGNQGDAKE
jgi:uncharacterized protein YndB with AHSA1/START domain